MDTYKLKFTQLQHEIFRMLCIRAGESFSQRALAGLLEVSPTAIANSLPVLEEQGLVAREKRKGMNLASIQLNRSQATMQLKRAENLKLVYATGLCTALEEKFPGSTIILFGSFSRGDDTIGSDIDIAVVGLKKKDAGMPSYERALNRQININQYGSWKEIPKELRENLCNGIVLVGGIEL